MMTTTSQATLALANHRPETIPAAVALMRTHDAIILEEPSDPKFGPMLNHRIEIDDYLLEQDLEYPEFSRRMAVRLRDLHRSGIRIYQIEPFIENLLTIHERFADGEGPSDLPAGSTLQDVYQAERSATAALIHFYDTSVTGTLDETIEAVKRFAHADAARFALRDRLRAKAMVDILGSHDRTYIEAGQIHYPIWQELRRRLPADYPLKVKFLMADAVRTLGRRRHLYGPGDLLTLLYRFHPSTRFRSETLLAAQALIYNKLIIKVEMVVPKRMYPHTRDELEVGAVTDRLSMADCRVLYPRLRKASTEKARRLVKRYLTKSHIGVNVKGIDMGSAEKTMDKIDCEK
jgi:hypothetical protein